MRKINPTLIAAAAAVGVAAVAMSKKKGKGSGACTTLYNEKLNSGYHISEKTMNQIIDHADAAIKNGATDTDTIAMESLSMIEPGCDWGAVMTGGGNKKSEAVLSAAQDIVFTLMNPPEPNQMG